MPPTTDTPADHTEQSGYGDYRRVVADSFAHWYGQGRDSWTGADTNAQVTAFVRAQAPAAPGPARRRVLDVGCGRGHQSTQLAEHLDADTTGLDLLDVWDA